MEKFMKTWKIVILVLSAIMFLIAWLNYLINDDQPSNMYILTTLVLTIQAYNK